MVTIVIKGEVSAVTQAIEVAHANGLKESVAHGVIANPHPEIVKVVEKSRSRFA